MTVRLTLESNRMATVVCAYAPTLDSQDVIKEAFYASLDNILSAITKEDIIILLGDFNARVGRDYTTWSGTMGKEGGGNINSMHPQSKHWHLIDYVIVRARDRRNLHLTRAMTSTDGR